MKISIPRDGYDTCRQICTSIAGDLALLAMTVKSKNFFSESLALLRCDLIDTAALMLKSAPPQEDSDAYFIETALYEQVIERIAGIAGIVIIYLETLRWESFQSLAGKLLDLLARLHNLLLAAS